MTSRIENVEALTADLFSDILRDNWTKQQGQNKNDDNKDDADDNNVGPEINTISVEKVVQGVLSDVYRVHLDYATSSCQMKNTEEEDTVESGSSSMNAKPVLSSSEIESASSLSSVVESMPPADWLVKFCRPDLDLSWMCRNEAIFYSRVAPSLIATSSYSCCRLPFTIPKFLSGSDQHIILQEVTNVETYPLSEGCPPDKIDFLLRSLAAWHATCWESKVLISSSSPNNKNDEDKDKDKNAEDEDEDRLVFPTGMGQRLPPLQKEGLFISSWQETIDHMRLQEDDKLLLDTELLDFITTLCQRLATLKLRDVHEKVHRHRVTCVHGDYHIANWLFPAMTTTTTSGNEDKRKRKPVLVDFATAGYGNPMIDFVFFLVVSTNDDTVSESHLFLEKYYQLLIECDPNLASRITLETLQQEWFPWAMLGQFMILVAYDGVCRDIVAAEQDKQKRESQTRHFCNVNRRMILAIRSIGDWDAILSRLETTTMEERQEAQLFCQNTALVI